MEDQQGVGSPLITQQECWYLQNQRGLRGEGSWLKDTLGIFQLVSYSELRSLGISSVSQTAVNERVWNYSILKIVTDLATTKQWQAFAQGFPVAVGKHASDLLKGETELYRQAGHSAAAWQRRSVYQLTFKSILSIK